MAPDALTWVGASPVVGPTASFAGREAGGLFCFPYGGGRGEGIMSQEQVSDQAPWSVCHVTTSVVDQVWEIATDKGAQVLLILLELCLDIFRDKMYQIRMDLPRGLCLWMEKAFSIWNMTSQHTKTLLGWGLEFCMLFDNKRLPFSALLKFPGTHWVADRESEKCPYTWGCARLLACAFPSPAVVSMNCH